MGDRGAEIGYKRWRGQERVQIDFTVMLSPEKFQASLGVSTQVFQKDRNIKLKKMVTSGEREEERNQSVIQFF